MGSKFGFSTEPASNADFLPRVQFDARAGQFTMINRTQQSDGSFENTPVLIDHKTFKAVFDLENLETGWADFSVSPPSFVFIPFKDMRTVAKPDGIPYPTMPSPTHKSGVRFTLKLAKTITEIQPIREITSNAKAFVGAVEELHDLYEAEAPQHPGLLPAVILDPKTPVIIQKTGSGVKTSTAYRPQFRIAAWVPRSDLQPVVRTPQPAVANGGNGQARPATGARPAAPPESKPAAVSADDFG